MWVWGSLAIPSVACTLCGTKIEHITPTTHKTVKQIRNHSSNNRENKEDNLALEYDIKELVEKVLNNEISLSESSELIMGYK